MSHQFVPNMGILVWWPCLGQPNGYILDTRLLLALPLPWHVIPGKESEVLSASCFPGRLP